MIPNKDAVRVICLAYGCNWTPSAIRTLLERTVQVWESTGFPPDRLAAQAEGLGSKWGSFKRKRRFLEQSRLKDVKHLALSHLAEPNEQYATIQDLYPDRDWLVYLSEVTSKQQLTLGWIPSLVGEATSSFLGLFRELLSVGEARYAFRYQQSYCADQMPPSDQQTFRDEDRFINAQEWTVSGSRRIDALLLRDVYAHNYLSRAHLDAPVGMSGVRLGDWIEADPAARGTLSAFVEGLTEWTPPPSNIAVLREGLFRAGRLYYHRFFKEFDYEHVVSKEGGIVLRSDPEWLDDPMCRRPCRFPREQFYRPNIHGPWEWAGSIPEMFRADLYQDRDPGTTL